MSPLRLVLRLLTVRGLRNAVTVCIVALGVGMMLAVSATVVGARGALSSAAARFPLVAGPRVGAVPLVLGSLTRLVDPGAAVPVEVYEQLARDERVEVAVPLLSGHAVQGYSLLATSPEYLLPRERFPLKSGRGFEPQAMEAVLGSEAAAGLGAALGDAVTIEHRHTGAPQEPGQLLVVGILDPTENDADRTVFCPLHAIYQSHGHGHGHGNGHGHPSGEGPGPGAHAARGVSSILLRTRDQAGLLSLQEELEQRPGVQVALTGQTLRRIADRMAVGGRLLDVLVSGVVLLTLLALLLSVYGASLALGRDVAILRVLGASRARVVAIVLAMTASVVLLGILGGVGLGALLSEAAQGILRQELGLEADVSLLSPGILAQLGALAGLLAFVGAQPALAAYRVQAAEALSEVPGAGRAARSQLVRLAQLGVAVAVVLWVGWAAGQHDAEPDSRPLEASSAALFASLESCPEEGPLPSALAERSGHEITIEGYMYSLGDPYEVQDFYLVAINPRLPRCPFCYKAPTRTERILVLGGGESRELYSSLVRVRGRLQIRRDDADPYQLDLLDLEVVIPGT